MTATGIVQQLQGLYIKVPKTPTACLRLRGNVGIHRMLVLHQGTKLLTFGP